MSKYRNELLIFMGTVLLFTLFNWLLPVTDPVEANYALTAKEMLQSGDYLNMRIYGAYWYDKPIFIYWSLIFSYNIFGINAFAARFPMAIASGLSLAFMYYFAARLYVRRIAWISVGILATCLVFWVIGKAIITDSLLFLFDCGGLGFFYLALREGRARYYVAAYAAFGLAVLTKGPIGIVLPGMILLAYCLCVKEKQWWKSLWLKRGILVFSAISLPWYLYMVAMHGNEFIQEFLGLHNVTRAMIAEHPKDNVFYYYLVLIPVYFMPWSAVFLQSIYALGKNKNKDKAAVFYLCWFFVALIFYSCMATKYPTYLFVIVFPAVLIMAVYVNRQLEEAVNTNWCRWVTIPIILFLLILMVGAIRFTKSGDFGMYAFLGVLAAVFWYLQAKENALRIMQAAVGGIILLMVVLSATILPQWLQTRSLNPTDDLPTEANIEIGIYGDYHASAVFYSGYKITKLVDVILAEDDVWAQKYTIPTSTWPLFLQQMKDKEVYLLIQNDKYGDFFKKNLAADYTFLNQKQKYMVFKKIKHNVLP